MAIWGWLISWGTAKAASAASRAVQPAVDGVQQAASDFREHLDTELPLWIERVGDAARSMLLVLSLTTAIAAGFLAGIGMEFIALVDKWSIVGMVVFYAAVTLALLSPFLIIPHTIRAWERRERRRRVQEVASQLSAKNKDLKRKQAELDAITDKHQSHEKTIALRQSDMDDRRKRLGEIRTERTQLEAALPQAEKRGWFKWTSNQRKPEKVELRRLDADRKRIETELKEFEKATSGLTDERAKLQTEIANTQQSLKEIEASRAEIHEKIEPPPPVKRLLAFAFCIYVIIAIVVLLNVFDGVWAFTTTLLTSILCVAIWKKKDWADLSLLGPTLTAYLVVIGYGIGLATYGYETNVTMEVRDEPHLVRILLATSNGFVIVKGPCVGRTGAARFAHPSTGCDDRARRELAFIPKERVGIVSVPRRQGPLAQLREMYPLKWIVPYVAGAWTAIAGPAREGGEGASSVR